MSVSLLEVIEAGGFSLDKEEDAKWLVSKVNEFEELVTKAEDLIEEAEEKRFTERTAELEAEL